MSTVVLPFYQVRYPEWQHRLCENVEAVENVEVIMQEWIETAKELGPIPKPKGRLKYA